MTTRRWRTVVLDGVTTLIYVAFVALGASAVVRGDSSGWVILVLGGVGLALRITIIVLNQRVARLRAAAAAAASGASNADPTL